MTRIIVSEGKTVLKGAHAGKAAPQHTRRLSHGGFTEDGNSAMTDTTAALDALRRPRLLVRTARFGLEDYRRERDLPRLLPGEGTPRPARALELLLAAEAGCEAARQRGEATYSLTRHVDLLIAIMGEARLAAHTADSAAAPAAPETAAGIRPRPAPGAAVAALRRAP
jgi:hypothetical protein